MPARTDHPLTTRSCRARCCVATGPSRSSRASSPARRSTAPTAAWSAARFLANVTKKRSIVFLISDFIDVDLDESLRLLGRKHDVVAVLLNDPRELELPNVGVIALEDAETGKSAYVDTSDRSLREAYADAARRRRLERRRALARVELDSLELFTDRPFVPTLMAFFNARTKRA